MRVDIEKIKAAQLYLAGIDQLYFFDIEWFEDGEKIELSQEMKIDIEKLNISNTDFIKENHYLHYLEGKIPKCAIKSVALDNIVAIRKNLDNLVELICEINRDNENV